MKLKELNKSLNQGKPWLPLFSLVLFLAGLAAASFLVQQRQLMEKKAAGEEASLTFASTSYSLRVGEKVGIPIMINTDGAETRGVDVVVNFSGGRSKISLTDIQTNATANTSLKTFSPIVDSGCGCNLDKTYVINQANSSGIISLGVLTFDCTLGSDSDGDDCPDGDFTDAFQSTQEVALTTLFFEGKETGQVEISFCLKSGSDNCGEKNVTSSNKGATSDTNIIAIQNDNPVDILNSVNTTTVNVTSAGPTPTPGCCEGDLSRNGSVDIQDFIVLRNIYIEERTKPTPTPIPQRDCCAGNFNDDEGVTIADFVLFRNAYLLYSRR